LRRCVPAGARHLYIDAIKQECSKASKNVLKKMF
jgi:hypothetical protein